MMICHKCGKSITSATFINGCPTCDYCHPGGSDVVKFGVSGKEWWSPEYVRSLRAENESLQIKLVATAKRVQDTINMLESPARHGLTNKYVCDILHETLALTGFVVKETLK